MSKIGTADIKGIMLGSTEIVKAYLGSDVVFQNDVPLPYDAEIEWVLSTGTQLILTDFMMDNSVRSIHVVFRCLDGRSNSPFLFGNRHSPEAFNMFAESNSLYVCFFTGSATSSGKNNTHKRDFFYDSTTGEITIADTESNTSSTITSSISKDENNTFKLFGNTDTHSTYRSYMMLYQAEIETVGGHLQLIPVRIGQIGYLYDKISGTLYGNDGSGSFVLGADKGTSLPYTQIEYLQSSGTQYINLGIKPQANELVEIKFQYVGVQSTMVMGCRTSGSAGKYVVGSGTSGTKIYAALGSAANANLLNFNQNVHSVVLNTTNGKSFIDNGDDVSVGTFSSNNLNIFLFAGNQNGTVSYQATARIMEVRIGTRMWLVPVRDGQTGYMYDKINRTLYGNAGTGNFILGADKN